MTEHRKAAASNELVAVSNAPVHKRKRASKPKVRTGCITCKIRRVKCGEERPACVRCTSTGRACDGYDNSAASSRMRIQESQKAATEKARKEFLNAYQWNEALRAMRPLVADIAGTDIEKRFFHRFRSETADGLTAHVCNFSNFWTRVAPQVSHSHEAVKHAVIALGAAHELFTFPDQAEISNMPRNVVEVFMIKQYNAAISQLAHHAASTTTENIHVTIVCCLIFICLETLRQNHHSAVTHLVNGLKILQSLPQTSLAFLSETDPYRPGLNASFDIEETARLFGRMEISASFASGVRPTLCLKSYEFRRFCTDENEPPFENLEAAHRAVCIMARDGAARLYEATNAGKDPAFWTDPNQIEQQRCQRERIANLIKRLLEFQEKRSPSKDSPEFVYTNLDRAHVACVQLMTQYIDEEARKMGVPIPEPPGGAEQERIDTAMNILERITVIQRCTASTSWLRRKDQGRRSFVTDTGTRGPLYIVAAGAPNEQLREKALSMLVRDGGREGFWDGQEALYRLVMERAAAMGGEPRRRGSDLEEDDLLLDDSSPK